MGLLKSVDNVPGIDYYEYRDQDYWNKFKYRARLRIPGCTYTYWAEDVEEWKERINRGKTWRGNLNSNEKIRILASAPVIEKFLELKKYLKKTNDKTISVRMEGDTTAIFSNDLAFIQTLKSWGAPTDVTESISNPFKGVKYFVNEPKHKFRVYFKSKRVEESVHKDIRDMLKSSKSMTPSNALKQWMYGGHRHQWKVRYLSSAYYIDYNDESTLSYLALMHGNLLGRKYKLEKRPDTE